MNRRAWIAAIAAAWTLLAAGSAHAAPTRTNETLRTGSRQAAEGVGCTTAQVTLQLGSADVIDVIPDAGEEVGFVGDVAAYVLDISNAGGRVIWTIGPRPDECASNDSLYGVDGWDWRTNDDIVWNATYRAARYALKASALHGVRSIAGWRVNGLGREAMPTIGRARKALGRPTWVRRQRGPYSVACYARWAQLGLTVEFRYLGRPGGPCRRGLVQAGTIVGGPAVDWAAVVGHAAGVVPGSTRAYLQDGFVGEPNRFGYRFWTLAELYWPIAESGWIPSVSATFAGHGRLRDDSAVDGFQFFVGAGGD